MEEIVEIDELVSSKLADGDYPDEQTIFNFIDKKLQLCVCSNSPIKGSLLHTYQ